MSALWKRRQADARNRKRGTKCEHASFTPLVLSACGGLATGTSTFYKRLASLLAEKWEPPYSITVKGATFPIMPSHLSVACIACIDLPRTCFANCHAWNITFFGVFAVLLQRRYKGDSVQLQEEL